MTLPRIVSVSALLAGALTSGSAFAQTPTVVEDKKPNILLIVDTSGSMEYMTGAATYPTCTPGDPSGTNERSRWIEVLETLTGTIDDYSCEAVDRSSSAFVTEFELPGNVNPPDTDYRNPYHRPLSYGCAITPDKSPALPNAFDWVAPLQAPYLNTAAVGTCSPGFSQQGNGFIDIYSEQARFGLMTFDSLPDSGTGHNGASSYTPNEADGVRGAWSYYGGAPAAGRPVDCLEDVILEVGVRNGAAPASEGKMIYFGDQDLVPTMDRARHDRLQSVLLATRPYGATPINGALDDARYFFWEDSSLEPTGAAIYNTTYLSPRFDEYVDCGCREQHIILITDGEPNLDMRPDCQSAPAGAGGTASTDDDCPYPDSPVAILAELSGASTSTLACSASTPGVNKYQIITHVVGYSTSTYAGGTNDCDDLSTISGWNDPGGTCDTNDNSATPDDDLTTCCTLHQLALAGGSASGLPHIAPDSAALQVALGDIMEDIVGGGGSGTQPVPSPGRGLVDDTGVAFRLLTSYYSDTGASGLWGGVVERLRWTCDTGAPVEQPKDPDAGDDFVLNVQNNMDDREFVTFVPAAETGGEINSDWSVRPFLDAAAIDDGAGTRGGSDVTDVGTAFVSRVSETEMDITMADSACTLDTPAADASACAARVLTWTLGYDNTTGRHRCADAANCSVVADIWHSTPTIVNRPTEPVEDETYETFAEGTAKSRPMIALMSSNDGILHGFNMSPNSDALATATSKVNTDAENNEYFAFLPPAVLPQLKNQYPETRNTLLDGVAVVKDVVSSTEINGSGRYLLERSLTEAKELTSSWRTIMVQSFGAERAGYFAVDITNPRRPSAGGDAGPKFLWQLTKTEAPADLFGMGGTPLITTVNLGGKEVAVAVLPGGRGGSPGTPGCGTRSNTGLPNNTGFASGLTPAKYSPRSEVNCYAAADAAARSLTVVRLDSGEIIRTFRRTFSTTLPEVPGLINPDIFANVTTGNPYLDSPITGVPAAFPSGAGMVADRIFVGDQDGGLWRVDVSDPDPQSWTMELFFDAYAEHGVTDGQPITTAPVLSVDPRGQITVNFATGAQDLTGGASDINYIYSLTEAEHPIASTFYAQVNWEHELLEGEHVVGPLTLHAGVLYFTTVDPSASTACAPSPGNIWGVDYLTAERPVSDPTAEPILGGQARLQLLGSTALPQQSRPMGDFVSNQGPVFGVSLEYVPTCAVDNGSATGSLIPGARTSVTQPSSSNLQLVFQGAGGDGAALGFRTDFTTVALAPPKTASSILSWAAILE